MTERQDSKRLFKSLPGLPLMIEEANEEKGIVSAWVSVFNLKDYAGDRTLFGKTFTEQIASGQKMPKVVWSHDWSKPIGKTIHWVEVGPGDHRLPAEIKQYGGLLATMQFNMEKEFARDVFNDIKGGFIDEYSYGYEVPEGGLVKNKETGTNDLVKVQVLEISPVLLGCNPATSTEGAKQKDPDPIDNQTDLEIYTEYDMELELLRSRYQENQ